jgi:hypothetical protein
VCGFGEAEKIKVRDGVSLSKPARILSRLVALWPDGEKFLFSETRYWGVEAELPWFR